MILRSPRQRLVLVVAWPAVTTWYVAASRLAPAQASPLWWGLTLVAGALGAAVVAGYVPEAGRKPDLGCSPCAAVSGLTVLGSTIVFMTYQGALVGPALAAAITAFGLVQRSASAAGCELSPTTSRPARPARRDPR